MELTINTQTLIVGIGCVVIPFCIYTCLYNLTLHPLKKYPGPWLARLSDCYAGWYAARGSVPLATFKDHQKYGDVMRYGPNRLIFNTTAALRGEFWEALGARGSADRQQDIYRNPSVTKSNIYLFSVVNVQPFIFNTIDRNAHLRKRKIISPTLSERSMRAFQPTIVEQIDIFTSLIKMAGPTKPVNVTDMLRRLSMDISVLLGFGTAVNLQTSKEYDYFFTSLGLFNLRINLYMNFPALSKLQLDQLLKRSPMRKRWRETIWNMVQARLKEDANAKQDFYSFVSSSLESEAQDVQQSELFSESLFFLSAAGDTISSALAATLFYLSRYPECYKKLAAEVRSTFNSEADIVNRGNLKRCKYLRACIDEALRMTPPIGGTLWREALDDKSQQPWVVDGHIVPPGTLVGVNTYSIHHNETYFPDSFTYNPDRWLTGDLSEIDDYDQFGYANVPEMRQAFNPFSAGTRGCAGKSMAYLEAGLVMAKIMWHFDFKQTPGELGEIGCVYKDTVSDRKPEFQTFDAFSVRHEGPYLNFTPRK